MENDKILIRLEELEKQVNDLFVACQKKEADFEKEVEKQKERYYKRIKERDDAFLEIEVRDLLLSDLLKFIKNEKDDEGDVVSFCDIAMNFDSDILKEIAEDLDNGRGGPGGPSFELSEQV